MIYKSLQYVYTIFKIDTGTDTSLKIYLINLDLEGRGMTSFDQSSVYKKYIQYIKKTTNTSLKIYGINSAEINNWNKLIVYLETDAFLINLHWFTDHVGSILFSHIPIPERMLHILLNYTNLLKHIYFNKIMPVLSKFVNLLWSNF